MAYIYEVSFDLDHQQLEQLKISRSLEKVIGYMRVLLPSQPGFVSTQALVELNTSAKSRLAFMSEWENWEDFETHRQSSLVEDKILLEFDPHIQNEHLKKRVYREIE
jgi:hypothetical protein